MARAIQKIRLSLLAVLWLSGILSAGTPAVTTAHRLLFLSGEDVLSSGGYLFGDGQKTGVLFFPFTYDLADDSSTSLYLHAAPGYGAAQYGSGQWMKIVGITFGGGIRYDISPKSSLRIGGDYQWMHFTPATVEGYGYDLGIDYRYDTWHGEWNPYLTLGAHYRADSVTQTGTPHTAASTLAKAQIGIITPVLAHPFGLPTRFELYGGGYALHGDLPTILQTRYLGYIGAKAYIQSPVLTQWISDITLSTQIVRGENFKGFSLGLGVKF